MTFPRYPEYKNSGVEWVGEVPVHWNVERLKVSIKTCRNGIWGNDANGNEYDIPCVRVADFNRIRLEVQQEVPTIRNVTEKEQLSRTLSKGNLLIEKSGGGENQPVGCVVLYKSTHKAVCSNFIAKIELAPNMDPSFWRFVHSAAYSIRLTIGSINQTSGIQNLDQDRYFNERSAYPPFNEQIAIAKFLEIETEKITILVAEQEKLIELLKEKHRVFITNAVTKGLDRTVEMKESGIDWIGLIPKHWTVRKLKFLAEIRTGDKDSENSVEDGDYPFFVRSQTIERINSYTYDCEAILTAGDGAGVGKVFHYVNGPFDFHQRVYMLNNFKEVTGKYLFHFFKENFIKVALEGGAKSTVDSLRRPMLTNFSISFPDIEEQKNIVTVIEEKAAEFDQLILQASNAIQLLQERRSALISAAVTGQIDVRNYQPKEIA
ncbi:restriction endonuclease subunit S [Polynucleobacter sp. HIN5]|uniref:restriction endonuclease subunit S n=1 Tax=Polynucleobacter sp. HIN5 TaxID=3047864 RepID=UPI002573923F|nr:restriction endonuclease subunit S [Polynucleobacter sp. HIN5]BEI33216.1 restriction endonuclease subunit S [Polynucleobacter sp. HIN5]